jgi:hypothetical protein
MAAARPPLVLPGFFNARSIALMSNIAYPFPESQKTIALRLS